jgi:hypothetical protein
VTTRLILSLVIAFSAAACGAQTKANVASTSTTLPHKSGLLGTVTVSPGTPTCKPGTSCGRLAAGVTLSFVHGGLTVRARTDSHGRYRITLPAGRWDVMVIAGRKGTPLKPSAATVPRGTYAKRNFTYDSGIR